MLNTALRRVNLRAAALLALSVLVVGCSEQAPEPAALAPGVYTGLWVSRGLYHSFTLEIGGEVGRPAIGGEGSVCELRREIPNRGGYRSNTCSVEGGASINSGRITAAFVTRTRDAFTMDASSDGRPGVFQAVLNGQAFGGDPLAASVSMVRGALPYDNR